MLAVLPATRVQQYSRIPLISRTLNPRRPSIAVQRGRLAGANGVIPLAAAGECPFPSLPPYFCSLCILAWCNARPAVRSVLCVWLLGLSWNFFRVLVHPARLGTTGADLWGISNTNLPFLVNQSFLVQKQNYKLASRKLTKRQVETIQTFPLAIHTPPQSGL